MNILFCRNSTEVDFILVFDNLNMIYLITYNNLYFFRIRQEKNGGAWCPKAQISSDVKEYLEVDLQKNHLMTWTETQGRFGNGQGQEYAEAFLVEYWRSALNQWITYKDSRGEKVCQNIHFDLIRVHTNKSVLNIIKNSTLKPSFFSLHYKWKTDLNCVSASLSMVLR